jgi:hypothetical protein
MTGVCKYCNGPEHTDERELAIEVFVDRYRRSGVKTLHEFAAGELVRQLKEAGVQLTHMGMGKQLPSYLMVVVEGTFDLALAAADYLRKHTQ